VTYKDDVIIDNIPGKMKPSLVQDNRIGDHKNYMIKNEQNSFFENNENEITWSNGMPSSSNYMQSRISDNKSTKMNNIQPFESIQTKPGDYTDEISRNLLREKTVDELRCKNNQKSSEMGLYGYEGPMSNTKASRPIVGIEHKQNPEKCFYNDPKNILPSLGYVREMHNRPSHIEKTVHKINNKDEYYGPSQSRYENENIQFDKVGQYTPSKRIEPTSLPLLSSYSKSRQSNNSYEKINMNSYTNDNKKSVYTENYFGPIKDTIGSMLLPVIDIMKPNRKDSMVNNMKPYLRVQKASTNTYVYDNTLLPVTLRESIENSQFEINSTYQKKGRYELSNITLPETIRDTTLTSHTGVANTSSKPRLYDAEYNMNDIVNKDDHISERMIPGKTISKGYSTDMDINITNVKTLINDNNGTNDEIRNRELIPTNYTNAIDYNNIGVKEEKNDIKLHSTVDNSYLLNQLQNNDLSIKCIDYK
jgi:hypothetical protein